MHERDVDGDPVDPGRESSLCAEVLDAAMDLDEHLLQEVFEIRAPADHALQKARHVGAIE